MDTHALERIANDEGMSVSALRQEVSSGRAVVFDRAFARGGRPVAVGRKLRTKVNANIGTSPLRSGVKEELAKLDVALAARADTVMDLSIGESHAEVRLAILDSCPVPVGTVPIYDILASGELASMDGVKLLRTIEDHGDQGVDFVTLHCGVTRQGLGLIDRRKAGVVSRGGAALVSWMRQSGRENPLYECFDEVLAITKEHNMAISLGDGFRPGALADAGDGAQMHELCLLGELVIRAREAGVKVLLEGPGHVPLHQVASQMETARILGHEAPLYVLGPLVLDSAAGLDHIAGAIGGALAVGAGAAFLCYLTPKEHLGLPGPEDVRQGVLAARLAARAGDVAKGHGPSLELERRMSKARSMLDWDAMLELALDPAQAARLRDCHRGEDGEDVCTMCGDLCAVLASREV